MKSNLTIVRSKNLSLRANFAALASEFQATVQDLATVEECARQYHARPRYVLKVAREVGIPVWKIAEIYEIRDYLPGDRKASILGVARLMRDFGCDIEEITNAIEKALDMMFQMGRERDVPRCIRLLKKISVEYDATSIVDILDAMETVLA